MKNTFKGLRTTIYRVSNIQEATRWYTDVFGTKPYFTDPGYVGFNIAGYELGLMADEVPEREKTGNVLSYWGVEDVETMYQALIKAGATGYESPHNVGGEIVVGAVKDPWDNVIGIIYNPEFKADPSTLR